MVPRSEARKRELVSDDAGVLEVRTLRDGGQRGDEVAGWIADFIGGARRSLDCAQYDFHLGPEIAAVVGGAIKEAAARGVGTGLRRATSTIEAIRWGGTGVSNQVGW